MDILFAIGPWSLFTAGCALACAIPPLALLLLVRTGSGFVGELTISGQPLRPVLLYPIVAGVGFVAFLVPAVAGLMLSRGLGPASRNIITVTIWIASQLALGATILLQALAGT